MEYSEKVVAQLICTLLIQTRLLSDTRQSIQMGNSIVISRTSISLIGSHP
jgi:hypothetical protein